jgi:hypothetical protein
VTTDQAIGMDQAPLLEWFVERADLDCVLVADAPRCR